MEKINKKIIFGAVIVILVVFAIYQGFFKKEKTGLNLVGVAQGNLVQEVSETGQVKKGEAVSLNFKNSGIIEKIYVAVGEKVKAGDILAKLKTDDLNIQLQDAAAGLSLVQAQLAKLLAGAGTDEIQISQTAVANSQISLDTANKNLKDAYGSAQNTLNDVYLKTYNAQNAVGNIQRTYFYKNDQEGLSLKEEQNEIATAISQIKSQIDLVQSDNSNQNIDSALSQSAVAANNIANNLAAIREICETISYRDAVSSTDKTTLDTQRTNINTVLTNLITSQQAITTKKSAVDSAAGALKTAEDELASEVAPPRPEDVNLYQAQVAQAEAKVQLLENQIQDAKLKSQVAGQIVDIKKEVGELAQPSVSDPVMTLLPASPFEIEVNIYEGDVVKIAVANPVDISLVAFPNQKFLGKIITIDPAQIIVDGVVYYKVDISFDTSTSSVLDSLKPGMTADITIKAAEKDNVLVIPGVAITDKNGKTFVQVAKDNTTTTEREIQVGLKGNDNMVEVLSGLQAGEKVAIPSQ